jgi:hypothetical protein
LTSDRTRPAILELAPHAIGLLLFSVFFGTIFTAAEAGIPRGIYSDSSFTLSLVEQVPLALVLALTSAFFVLWLISPVGRGRLAWQQIDSIGGFRWPVFVVAMTLAWAYAGYSYNYYLDQSHVWDRWLLVLLMLGTLRSPLLIPIFVLEIVVSRAQFSHPINAVTPIGDELPIRLLGIVVGCALWNGLLDGLKVVQSGPRFGFLKGRRLPARIQTQSMVFSVLCLIGFYYAFAGLGKLMLGANPSDWLMFSHMENLFVASHPNGWLNHVSEARILELAQIVRALHFPIAITTLAIELGMVLILLRRRGTLLLLAAVSSMHLGIVVTSGIIFWKWMSLDLALLVWLWLRRNDEKIRRMYSPSAFVVSLVMIGAISVGLDNNYFAWWNTKWIQLNEVEVIDESGNSYLVDFADFSPYTLFDMYKPAERRFSTNVYAMSVNQRVMKFFEEGDPGKLERFFTPRVKVREGPKAGGKEGRKERIFGEFMTRYFMNRNRTPGRRVPPFWLGAPSLHNRHLSGPDLYRDQAPVVEVRLRFREIYYSGSELELMRNEIVYSFPIPRTVSSDSEPSPR